MKNFFLSLFALFALCGCDGGIFVRYSEEIDMTGEAASHDMIVLGERLEDPYNVENMTKAVAALYPTKADRVVIDPTDIYVRFLPSDESELARLENMGLTFRDYPVDYEIVRDGDYYHDPGVAEGSITWQYTVVPVDFDFPDDIYFERLHDCFLPDNASATKAAEGIDWTLVEAESFKLTGNGDLLDTDPATKADNEGIPRGRICIEDEDAGVTEGVKGVKVSCNVFVKFDNAFTDEEGNYEMTRTFSSKPRYRLVFKNRHGFALGFNLILVPASGSTLGRGETTGLSTTVTSASNRKLFTRCVVNNAAYDYYEQCEGEDAAIKAPPANLRIWLFQKLRSSSSVMMRQGAVVSHDLVKKYLKEYASLLKIFLPDITLGLAEAASYAEIYSLTVHELAHASHYMVAGNDYWNKYIEYILSSYISSGFVSYGSGTEENHGYCEVGEMWAYYMQSRLYNDRYPSDACIFGTQYWFCPQIFYTLDEKGLDKYRLFAVLGKDIVDRDILKKKMTSMYPQFKTAINQAFTRYQ